MSTYKIGSLEFPENGDYRANSESEQATAYGKALWERYEWRYDESREQAQWLYRCLRASHSVPSPAPGSWQLENDYEFVRHSVKTIRDIKLAAFDVTLEFNFWGLSSNFLRAYDRLLAIIPGQGVGSETRHEVQSAYGLAARGLSADILATADYAMRNGWLECGVCEYYAATYSHDVPVAHHDSVLDSLTCC